MELAKNANTPLSISGSSRFVAVTTRILVTAIVPAMAGLAAAQAPQISRRIQNAAPMASPRQLGARRVNQHLRLRPHLSQDNSRLWIKRGPRTRATGRVRNTEKITDRHIDARAIRRRSPQARRLRTTLEEAARRNGVSTPEMAARYRRGRGRSSCGAPEDCFREPSPGSYVRRTQLRSAAHSPI